MEEIEEKRTSLSSSLHFFLRWGDCWVLARVGLATRRSDKKQKTKIKIFGLAPESGARHFARVVKGLAC